MCSPFVENIDDAEEIDELLATAKKESLRHYREIELPLQEGENEVSKQEDILSTQVGGKAGSLLYEGVEAKGFHLSAGSTYIYPTNYPVRHYQAAIVKTALFKNTLVSLPTGLGKTFIAAVVMYNFYRWYPHGKVVFMAPTRPLVAQQTKACHHIMNIPQEDTTEMTGVQSAEQRSILWKEKRVFYLTPQVMVNDLKQNTCPASLIKCIVLDEAHRATKDYAYCQVLKMLFETDAVFRILGLSATPGNDINAVQQVIQNLHISALEMRSEESLDVQPYTHSRAVDTVIVDLSNNIQRVKEDLLQVYEKYAKKLKDFKALSSNISSISRFQVLKACEKFRANPPRGVPPAMIGSLISDFNVCMSLAHALELLQIYGLRAFYSYLSDDNGEKSKGANRLKNDADLKEMLARLQCCLYPKQNDNVPYTWGHPKLQRLVTALSEHFQKAEQNKESTKAIIFCQYRVVVSEIVELLTKFKPLIKATEFIGQSGGKDKGMPQAKQLQIMKDFRSGIINCLVATCVAEEGLDIGEVDLIVLMEAHKSPVRLVQRLGRTGRKRKGHCIVLLTRGKEEQKFHDAMATRKSYVQNIINAPAVKSSLCQESPRMIPPQYNPVQQLVHIQASSFKSPARPVSKKQADIRNCFTAQVPAHSAEGDLLKAKEELGDLKLNFMCIPKRHELWHKQRDKKISVEELLSKELTQLSEWNEWNYEEQPTYHISHTPQTKLLCYILKLANKEIALPEYSSIDLNLDVKTKDALVTPNENTKAKFSKNVGMDIRTCMANATEKSKTPEKQIIEILSDHSEDGIPIECVEPLPKKLKISKEEEAEISVSHEVLTSVYEENTSICTMLSNYLLPKNKFKQSFSFDLPDVKMVLNNVTFEVLLNLNFTKVSIVEKIVADTHLPIENVLGSPFSSTFFEIDDLFDDESISDKNEILNSNVEMSCSVEQEKHCLTDSSEKVNLQKVVDTPYIENRAEDAKKDVEDSCGSNGSCVESILNDQINSNIDISFSDIEEEFVPVDKNEQDLMCLSQKSKTNSEKCVGPVTEKDKLDNTQQQTTLTSLLKMNPPGRYTVNNTDNHNILEKQPLNESEKNAEEETCGVVDEEAHSFHSACLNDSVEKNKILTGKTNKSPYETDTQRLIVPGIACSTPNMSVKKFKKNIIVFGNSTPLVDRKEVKKSPSSEGSDIWNVSDLFEDDEANDVTSVHNSTMLGITQMVSLIEKEKKRDDIRSVSPKTEIISKSDKTSNFSAFLDSDVDLFSGICDNECGITQIKENENGIPPTEIAKKKEAFQEYTKNNDNCDGNDKIRSHPIVSKTSFNKLHFENNKLNSILCKNTTENSGNTKSYSLDFLHSERTNESQPKSQPLNFKKFTSKKILFSQKVDIQHDLNEVEKNEGSTHRDNIQNSPCPISKKDISSPEKQDNSKKKDMETEISANRSFETFHQICDDSEEDDIFLLPCKRKKEQNSKSRVLTKTPYEEKSFPQAKIVKERTKQKNRTKLKERNELIEVEADVSGCDSSDDSEGSSLDNMDNSFINDDSECITNCTQTIYLKSVKSPMGPGKFKIPERINYEDNVFSQQVVQDSEYINDSFCVDSDEVMDEDNETSLSLLEIAEQKLQKKPKERKWKDKKRRRILNTSSDSPSPEKCSRKNTTMSEPSPGLVINRKKRRINSDSETEVSPLNKKSFHYKKQKHSCSSAFRNLDNAPLSEVSVRKCMVNVKAVECSNDLNLNEKVVDLSKDDELDYSCHSKGKKEFESNENQTVKVDESLKKLTKKFTENLTKIRRKYFSSDDSSDEQPIF